MKKIFVRLGSGAGKISAIFYKRKRVLQNSSLLVGPRSITARLSVGPKLLGVSLTKSAAAKVGT